MARLELSELRGDWVSALDWWQLPGPSAAQMEQTPPIRAAVAALVISSARREAQPVPAHGGRAGDVGAERGPGLSPGRVAAPRPSGLPGGLQGRERPAAATVMGLLRLLRSCGHGRSAR